MVWVAQNRYNEEDFKVQAQVWAARIKLVTSKKHLQIEAGESAVAQHLQSAQHHSACIHVVPVLHGKQIIRGLERTEMNIGKCLERSVELMESTEIPPDLKQAISSIIYASSRLDGVVDLAKLKEMFKEKYGQLYVDRASRDSTCDACEVPQDLRKFLQLEAFTPEEKLALLVEIGNKKAIKWDVTPLTELLGIQHTLPQRQPL